MPRGDRTGPMGMGPMTGRGAGFCAGFNVPGFMNAVSGRGGMGFGRGRGRGSVWAWDGIWLAISVCSVPNPQVDELSNLRYQ